MQANTLRAQIALAGVTQAGLARLCGGTENTLCNKMQGRTEFKTDEIMKICEALDIQDAATRGEIFLT